MPTGKPSGIFCPLCDRQQVVNSVFFDDHGKFRCSAQSHGPFTYGKVMAMNPRLQTLEFHEKQPEGTVAVQIWAHPDSLIALQDRYPKNLMTTLDAILAALADPDTLLIEGTNARELRELGVHSGRDIVGLARANKDIKSQLEEARMQQKILEPLLRMMGHAAATMGAATGAAGGVSLPSGNSSSNPTSIPPGAEQVEGGYMLNGEYHEQMDGPQQLQQGFSPNGLPEPTPAPQPSSAAPMLQNLLASIRNNPGTASTSPMPTPEGFPMHTFAPPSPVPSVINEDYEPSASQIMSNLSNLRESLSTPHHGIPDPTPGPTIRK